MRALYQSVGSIQTVDIGLQLGGKLVVVDAQDGCLVVVVDGTDNGGHIQSTHRAVVHHLIKELARVGRGGAGVEVPAQRRYARYTVGTHALLTGHRVVEGLAYQQSHLGGLVARCHLLQSLYLVYDGVDIALAVVVGIHHALVKHGIGQVVYQHLNADVGGARVLLLLASGVLLLPLGLALATEQVALADILHDILDGLFDRALTNALSTHQQVHKRGFVVHVVPVAEVYAMQMGAQGRKHGTGHGGLVVPRHVAGEQLYQRRQSLGQGWGCADGAATGLYALLLLECLQHLFQAQGHAASGLFQCVFQGVQVFGAVGIGAGAVGLRPVVGHDGLQPLHAVAADAAQGYGQLEGECVPVAHHRHLATVKQLPVLRDNIRESHAVVGFFLARITRIITNYFIIAFVC